MKITRVWATARRFALGAFMIAGLSAPLLYSDRNDRPASGPTRTPAKMYRIGIACFAPEEGNELCIQGLLDDLHSEGFVEGQNLEVRKSHGQAEIGNIPAMMQNFDSQGLDLIMPMSTPCLTAACNVVKKTPMTFVYVYDPIAAGAGKSWTDHRPNVTGVGSFPEIGETFDLIQELVPGVRQVGTLYNSSEANSRKAISVGREACARRGLKLEACRSDHS